MDKLYYMHMMEYCSTIKRDQLLMQAPTWVNLKGIMLSERSQRQKVIHLKDVEYSGGLGLEEEENGEFCLMGIEFHKMERVMGMDGGDAAQHWEFI